MIRADARSRLSRRDLDLVILLLSRGSALTRARLEQRLISEGPDALLDDPDLPERLLAVRTILIPSETLLFYVLARHALRRMEVEDRELADYVTALLVEFGRRDRAWRVDWNDDGQHQYVVDMLADLDASDGVHRFKVMVHLGNYTLWLAGLFPDYIAARQVRRGGPALAYYDAMGQRGYALASDHTLAEAQGLDTIFRAAADRFPAVRSALNAVSDRVFFPHHISPARIDRELDRSA